MKSLAAALLLIGYAFPTQAQTKVSQSTNGTCSPAVVSQGKVTITCTGLDSQQLALLKKMPQLMEQLLKQNQADRDEVVAKLEEILALEKPVTLTEKQSTAFVTALKVVSNGTVNVGFTSTSADKGLKLAQQLMPLFENAGWTVQNGTNITNHLDIEFTGVGILVKADQSGNVPATPTLLALREAFKAVSIDAHFIAYATAKDDVPEIVIGSREF